MFLQNLSFGIFAFLPQGWLFMIFVIILECFIASKFITGQWATRSVFPSIIAANLISGILGIVVSMILYGGWYMVVWFPWVSSHEIDLCNPNALQFLVIFYAVAFVVSVLLEAMVNILILRKRYPRREVVVATLVVNLVSYLVGSVLLYSYSFR